MKQPKHRAPAASHVDGLDRYVRDDEASA